MSQTLLKIVQTVVLMGPSGCGKTTLGKQLASSAGYRFVEGDDLHPPTNLAKLAAGNPLTDDDWWPWLDMVVQTIRNPKSTKGLVVACSALKRAYRDYIRDKAEQPILFILPDAPPPLLRRRLLRREDHYMPAALLDSQLDGLERPGPEEGVVVLNGADPSRRLLASAQRALKSFVVTGPASEARGVFR